MNWLEFFSVYLNITATWQWTNVYWHYLLSHVLYGIHSHLTDDYEMYNKCRVWKVQCILNNDWYSRSVQDLMGRQMYSSCVCVYSNWAHTYSIRKIFVRQSRLYPAMCKLHADTCNYEKKVAVCQRIDNKMFQMQMYKAIDYYILNWIERIVSQNDSLILTQWLNKTEFTAKQFRFIFQFYKHLLLTQTVNAIKMNPKRIVSIEWE